MIVNARLKLPTVWQDYLPPAPTAVLWNGGQFWTLNGAYGYDMQIAQGGNLGELSNYQPLTVGEPNYSRDDPTSLSTPDKIAQESMRFRSASRNKSWSTMDLSRELALEDPVGAITGGVIVSWYPRPM